MLDAPSYPPAFVEVGDMRLEFYKAEFEDGILSAEVKFKEIGNGAK
jgi:hypothetical protein